MPIEKTNIKLYASERLDDTPQGAGRITGNEIVSGQENSVFPDISQLDRTYGRIQLRKLFPAVDTTDTDVYQGAHMIVSEIPQDPNVSITMFSTKDWDDTREDMKDYVERYLSKGTKWIGYLLETQLTGQKAILVWQRTEIELPSVGSVWALVANEGTVNEYEQYVRIIKVSEKLQNFYDERGEYTVRLLTIEISDPLLNDFVGVAPSRSDTALNPPTKIRTTLPVDAARYYSTKKLSEDITTGQMTITAQSIYSQLVPSAQTEVPAVDVSAGVQTKSVIDSATGNVSFITSASINANVGLYLGNGCKPGTLSITVSGGTITDDGGDLKLNGTTVVGSIQYDQGILSFNTTCPNYTGSKTVTFFPAATAIVVSDTASIHITPETRRKRLYHYPSPISNSGFCCY